MGRAAVEVEAGAALASTTDVGEAVSDATVGAVAVGVASTTAAAQVGDSEVAEAGVASDRVEIVMADLPRVPEVAAMNVATSTQVGADRDIARVAQGAPTTDQEALKAADSKLKHPSSSPSFSPISFN